MGSEMCIRDRVGVARNPPVFMDEGDLIEIEVKPIGTLSNSVMREK